MKRITCIILTLALLITASPAALAAIFGEELKSDTSTLAEGTELTNVTDWSPRGYLRENYVTYTPNDNVVPTVVYGSKLCNYGSYSSMAELLESRGRHAIASVNGDYYDTATYAPLGIVISDGRLISSDAGHYAVAFREDGRAFVCEPKIEMSFVAAGEKFPVTFFNKVRTGSYFTLLTDEFAYNTKNTSPGTDVILSVPEGTEITANCSFTATVEDIVKSRGAMDIPAGKLVLTVSDESDPWRLGMLDTISVGSTLDFTFSCSDERFADVTCAVGALYRLLEDGSVCSGLDNTANPRTALGVKSDGSTVLYTVDGRQSGYSAGASMNEVAKRLLELGCTDAALLDGGGSTHMSAIFVGADGVTQINSPSGGSPRSVTSYLMLTTDASAKSGTAAILGISPMSVQLLCGARTNFGFGAADSAGYPAFTPGKLEAALGTITQSGAYTAPDTPCTDTVT